MKVAFDEHVPIALVKVFVALAKEGQIQNLCHDLEFVKASDYVPKATAAGRKKDDAPWLDKFASAGGKAVISGDVRMRERPHERLALYQNGFVVIFFERKWSQWNFYHKSALILFWWKQIVDKIKSADSGTFWVVPGHFPREEGQLRNVSLGLAQLLTDNPTRAGKPKSRRRNVPTKPSSSGAQRQSTFLDALERPDVVAKKED